MALHVLACLIAIGANFSDAQIPTVSADFDGDLRLDTARINGNSIELAIGPTQRSIPKHASSLAVGDIDCDGRIDLVLDGGTSWIPNRDLLPQDNNALRGRAGGIAGASPFEIVWSSTGTTLENVTRHLIADFDNDGRNELVTADYNGPNGADIATLRIFENNADNTWTQVWSFSDGPRIFNAIIAADTDGDGVLELIAGKIGGSYLGGPYVGPRVYIFETSGNNSLTLQKIIELDPGVTSFNLVDDLAVADADADGHLDLAVGLADNETVINPTWGSRVRMYTYNAGASDYLLLLNHTQNNTGIGWLTAIDIGDSDLDGKMEVVFFERIIVNIFRLENDIKGFDFKSTPSGIPAGICSHVMVIDADGNGTNDLLCGGSAGANGHMFVFKSTANDAYTLAFQDSLGIDNTVLYVAADLSVTPPLLAGAAHSKEAIVLQYNPDTDLYQTLDFFTVPSAAQLHEITIGDLDDDCGLDLMLTNFNGSFSTGTYEQRELTPVFADLNCTAVVDVDDLLALINSWGDCDAPPAPCPADISPKGGNGVIDVDDLLTLINSWG